MFPILKPASVGLPAMSETTTSEAPIPVSLLTGFLGSGKTTLLNRLLQHPEMAEAAVLINEFGEIGLDHHLVERLDENTVLLNAGCLCCTVQGDLVNALSNLFIRRSRGEIPWFRRVLIETTGLADPAPVIHTLMTAPLVSNRYSLDGIITTVDGVNAGLQMDRHQEAVKQAAVADRILITKPDLAIESALSELEDRIVRLNPGAPRYRVLSGDINPGELFDAGLYNPSTKTFQVEQWLREASYSNQDHDHRHDVNRHDSAITAFCLTRKDAIDWEAFIAWIRILIGRHGEKLLRIKGILNIAGREKPIAIHGVQHTFHDPAELPDWPDGDQRTRIVFITCDLERSVIEDKLDSLQDQAKKLTSE